MKIEVDSHESRHRLISRRVVPEIKKTYTEQGFLFYPPMTPKAIDAFVKADKNRWKGYVAEAGITPT